MKARLQFTTVALAIFALALPVQAQKTWSPSRNVEIVVGSAPGGSNDKTARSVEKAIVEAKLIPTSLTVVNRPGGGSTIAFAYVRQKKADPHTLLIGTTALLSNHIVGTSRNHRYLRVFKLDIFLNHLKDLGAAYPNGGLN